MALAKAVVDRQIPADKFAFAFSFKGDIILLTQQELLLAPTGMEVACIVKNFLQTVPEHIAIARHQGFKLFARAEWAVTVSIMRRRHKAN